MPCDTNLDRKQKARQRWKILGDVLRKKNCNEQVECSASVRRFTSFGLLETSVECREPETNHMWYKYQCSLCPSYQVHIRHLDGSIHLTDLLGFNNTGNVCVWPAEEVLTYFCLQHLSIFKGKVVCELGGGMTCLAGVTLAVNGEAEEVMLTDGNEQSAQNVDVICTKNLEAFGSTKVTSRVLRWDSLEQLEGLSGKFDYIICADCLFFDEYQKDLINTLQKLLHNKGEAFIFAPRRGNTFKKFCDLASETFTVEFKDIYDDVIHQKHLENSEKGTDQYDENIHYPLYLNLKK